MSRPLSPAQQSCAAVFGLLLQVVPCGYVAITGHAPMWVRIWLGSWLATWLIVTAAKAARTTN